MSQLRTLFRLTFAIALAGMAAGEGRAQSVSPFAGGAWCGNVTPTTATVKVRLASPGLAARLALATNARLDGATYTASVVSSGANGNIVTFNLSGLEPHTAYHYGVEVSGVLRDEAVSRGRFRSFPRGAGSFKLALIGDGDPRDPDSRVHDAVAAEDPLLLLYNGDLHYGDITTTVVEDYRAMLDAVLNHPGQGALFRSAPVAYVWDDHDFSGGNNSDGTAPGGAAATTAYRERVPHYPIGPVDGTIGQAFTVGRVRVIMTDLRSAASPASLPEGRAKTKLGAGQKAWLKEQLVAARDAAFPLIIWMSPVPWIAPAAPGDDSWGGYATERAEIADFIRDNRIRNLVIFSGDMHALAYDDGAHSDYATGGGAPVIVLHATPLTRDGNAKGGPYTAGPFLGTQQYGILEVTDTGGATVQCRFRGMRLDEGAKFIVPFSASAASVETRSGAPADTTERVLVNISARGRLVSAGDSLVAGFVVAGKSPRTLLMRAVGPSLTAFGVSDAIALPMISLYRGPALVASNENWSLLDSPRLTAAFDRVGAFRLAGAGSRDAALLLTLEPGAYTVQATNLARSAGSVLLEVYEVP